MVQLPSTDNCLEVQLTFSPDISTEPLVSYLARDYGLTFSILQARITPREEGHMTLKLMGSSDNIQSGISYLKQEGVKVTGIAHHIARVEDLCMHCGMCLALCTAGALGVAVGSRLVTFDVDLCTACGLCARVCPVHSMVLQVKQGKL